MRREGGGGGSGGGGGVPAPLYSPLEIAGISAGAALVALIAGWLLLRRWRALRDGGGGGSGAKVVKNPLASEPAEGMDGGAGWLYLHNGRQSWWWHSGTGASRWDHPSLRARA